VKPERCPSCGRRVKRTTQQNARYWLLLSTIAAEVKPQGNVYSVDSWHEYFKVRYLGAEERPLPNGRTLILANSSAELGKDEFADYMTQVEVWGNEHGVYLEETV
jgi:hypothetical protein